MHYIRNRLTLLCILIMIGVLVVFAVFVPGVWRAFLENDYRTQLQNDTIHMAARLSSNSDLVAHPSQNSLNTFITHEAFAGDDGMLLVGPNMQPLFSSYNWRKDVFLSSDDMRGVLRAQQALLMGNGNHQFYIYGQTVTINGQIKGYLFAMRSAESGKTALRLLITVLVPGVILNIGLAGLLIWLLIRRAMRPLEHLAATTVRIAEASDHSLRLKPRGRPDEINSLTHAINSMLQSLDDAYQQVQKVNDLQRNFLADVSHELRTPLTVILSSLDLMRKEEDPEFQVSALESIHTEAERMARMVTQLLILARTDRSATVAREPLLIGDIINEVCEQGDRVDEQTTVQCQGLACLEDAVVEGNADYLKQLFLILLENAIKYTPDGGSIEVISELKEDMLAITVADPGIGIASADLPKIFDRFYRAENARFRSGMGLGLSIAKSIAVQHGGDISIESEPGHGSRFTVSLPLLNDADEAKHKEQILTIQK
ncbi:MAG TPA: HAMP domain-containing sensor histidine kinase [Ktedonobacteraceae bacterium]|nr:HAMP domain-containing sensor histidine kinase [Ktedonobacteraceae bacterium]